MSVQIAWQSTINKSLRVCMDSLDHKILEVVKATNEPCMQVINFYKYESKDSDFVELRYDLINSI